VPTPSELNQDQWDGQANGREQRDGLTRAGVEDDETKRHKGTAGEVEAERGKQPPPPTAFTERDRERDNTTGAHEVVRATALAVKPPPYDRVPDECYLPPPPDPPPRTYAGRLANNTVTAQTPQVDPTATRNDEHNRERDERALMLVVTDAAEPLNNGSTGEVAAAAAAATATARAVDSGSSSGGESPP
jgi:hypothetical protein